MRKCVTMFVLLSLLLLPGLLCAKGDRSSRMRDVVNEEVGQLPTDTPLDAFVADYMSQRTWEDKRNLVRYVRELGKRAYNAGLWDGETPTWENPLPLDTFVLDDPPEGYYEENQSIKEEGDNSGPVEYFYPEDMDSRDDTVCSRSTPSYYFGNVLVTGSNCVWSANITMEGYLSISGSGNLTIQNSSSSIAVEVQGKNYSSRSILVSPLASLTVNAPTYNYFRSTTLDVAKDSYIFVEGKMNATVTNANNSISIGGVDGSNWRGIFAESGSEIVFNGTTNKRITLNEATGKLGFACLGHEGGTTSSSNPGKLQLKGVRFPDCDYVGVSLEGSGYTTTTYMTAPISVEYCYFDGAETAVSVKELKTQSSFNNNLNIKNNDINNYGGIYTEDSVTKPRHGIYIYEANIDGIVYVQNNSIDDATSLTSNDAYDLINAIYLEKVISGPVSSIVISDNTAETARNGIKVNNYYSSYSYYTPTGNKCQLTVTDNTITDLETRGIDISRDSSYATYCDDSNDDDILEILDNTLTSGNSGNNGITLTNFQTNIVGTDYETSGNDIEGFYCGMHMESTTRNHYVQSNEFRFGGNTSSTRRMLYLAGSDDNTVGGASGYGNCFNWIYNGTEPNVYHIYNTGSNNVFSYNDYQGSQHIYNGLDEHVDDNVCP